MTDDEQRQLDIIGYNLSRLLKQNGATQRELASAIGVSESAGRGPTEWTTRKPWKDKRREPNED